MLTGESFHGKPVDIWACGITLYMLIYGRPPYTARTMTELYGMIQVRLPAVVSGYNERAQRRSLIQQNDPIPYPEKVGDRVVEKELLDLLQHVSPSP